MSSTLLAAQARLNNINKHQDPWLQLQQHIDCRAMAAEVDHACPGIRAAKGGLRPWQRQ